MKTKKNHTLHLALINITLLLHLIFTIEYVQAGSKPTKILQHVILPDIDALLSAQKQQNPRDLDILVSHPIPSQENMWVIVNYIAEVNDTNLKGETILGLLPEGIPATSGEWGIIFKSNKMADFKKKH